jgi:muconolactone delta-isomerase
MRFMVEIQVAVPPERREEVAALTPAERAHVAEQIRQGTLEALYLDEARPPTHVWVVLRADTLEEAQRLIADYPLHDFYNSTYTSLRD